MGHLWFCFVFQTGSHVFHVGLELTISAILNLGGAPKIIKKHRYLQYDSLQ